MTRSSLKHALLVSSLALGMIAIAPVFYAKAGCGCGAGTNPTSGQSQSPVSKSDQGSNVRHGDTGLVFNGCRGSCNGGKKKGGVGDAKAGETKGGPRSGGLGDNGGRG